MKRYLSPNEKLYLKENVYILMESRTSQRVSIKDAQKACEILCTEHPFLRASIEKDENNFYIKPNATPSFVMEESFGCPEEFVRHLMNQPASNTLCQFHLVHGEYKDSFITYFHHALADGVSNQKVHQRFFQLLEKISNHEEIKPSTPYPLPRSLLNRLSHNLTNQYIKHKLTEFDIKYHQGHIEYLSSNEQSSKSPKEISRKTLRLPQNITLKLQNLSKALQVSMNALLCAFLLKAVSKHISRQAPYYLAHDIPFDARKLLNPVAHENELACYVGVIFSKVLLAQDSSISQIAKQIYINTKKALEPQSAKESLLLINERIESGNFLEPSGKIFLYTSNLGKVNFDHSKAARNLKPKYIIDEFYFHAACHAPFITTFNSINNQMNLSFVFTKPLVSESFIETLIVQISNLISSEITKHHES